MKAPDPFTIDRGDIFQINPDVPGDLAWNLIIADKVHPWGIEGILFENLEVIWLGMFRAKSKICIAWKYLEYVGHIKMGRDYEDATFEEERKICSS